VSNIDRHLGGAEARDGIFTAPPRVRVSNDPLRLEPDKPGFDLRTYACLMCAATESIVVAVS
jgi:hypothetical protein